MYPKVLRRSFVFEFKKFNINHSHVIFKSNLTARLKMPLKLRLKFFNFLKLKLAAFNSQNEYFCL